MERVTFNFGGSNIRRAKLHGRDYIVAPMTLIQPGVLHGSQGSLFYPPTEVVKNYRAWDHVPLVVYHPKANGAHISARNPKILQKQGVGIVLQTRIHNGALKAEGWFDVEKVKKVDNRVLSALESGQRMEISTGLFTNNVPAHNGAQYNGKPYSFVALNYRPDHLAVLPDQKGACSLDDGCGLNVNYSAGQPRDSQGRFGSGGGGGGGSKLAPDTGGGSGGGKSGVNWKKAEESYEFISSSKVDLVNTAYKAMRESVGNATDLKVSHKLIKGRGSSPDVYLLNVDQVDGVGGSQLAIWRQREGLGKYRFTVSQQDISLPKADRGKGLGGRMIEATAAGIKAVGAKKVPIHMESNPGFWNKMRKRHRGLFSGVTGNAVNRVVKRKIHNAGAAKWITIRGTPVKIGAGGAIVGGPAALVKVSEDRAAKKGGGAKPPPHPGKRPPPLPKKKQSIQEKLLGKAEKATQQVFDEAKTALGEAKTATVGRAKKKLGKLKGKAADFAQKKLDTAQKLLDSAGGKKNSPKPPPKPKPRAKEEPKAQKETESTKQRIAGSKNQGPMLAGVNLPKNPRKVNQGQAKQFLESKGMKMGKGRTDLKTGKTSYHMTGGKAGSGMWLSAAKIKSLMYKAAGGGNA